MAVARPRLFSLTTAAALAAGGALVVAPPASAAGEAIVTTASEGQYSEVGAWATARAPGYGGTPERYSRVPGSTATWTVQAPVAATYQVSVFYSHSVDNARVEYSWTGGPDTPTIVDQTSNGGDWYVIGTADLDQGEQFRLTLTAGEGRAVTTPEQNVITRANAVALRPVAEAIVTTASEGRYSEVGSWATARAPGYGGTPERYSRVPGSTATWTAQAPVAATYQVSVFYSHSVDNARVEYSWTGGPDTPTIVDQTSNGGDWHAIGTAYLDEGQQLSLTLTAGDGAAVTTPDQNVITRANAVRIRELGADPDPVPGTCTATDAATPAVDAPRQDFGSYALEQSGTTVRLETPAWAMDVDRAGFRYALSSDGVTRAAAHPVAGLQLALGDGPVCDALTATVTGADETGVTASVLFAGGRTATVHLYPSEHSVRIAVRADDGSPGKVRAQVAGGLSPAYGLGDLGGFRQSLDVYGVRNLDYYAQHASGTTNQRFVSNFTVFPNRRLAQVSMSDERLAIQVDADATMLGVDGAAMEQMHYFFGDMPTIYAAYAEARRAAGYVDTEPEYQFFGVGYESYGALGYNTNQATITASVREYLARGYPLSWAVTGSGFWPYGSGSAQGTTSSFGLWGPEKYPDPEAYKEFFASNGIAMILGARQSFRALPADGGTYDPALDGDGTLVGIERGYFIKDADGSPRVFTPVSFPNTAMYLIDPDNAEAVAWYADRMTEWGAAGFKEDHMFNATANGYVDNSLVAPVNEALDGIGLMMVRNSAFSVAGSILRINDTDYNQGGNDRDRTVVNGLAYAASGQPNFYPDIVGGRIISDLETNTAKQRYLTRNAMMAAMSPSMSFGNEPWRMNDPELVEATLKAAQWHGRYQPYIYSAAVQSFETGYPGTATPLPIAYPDDPATYSLVSYSAKQYEWLLGPSLLVAPLYGSDATTATSRDVYLPAGEWMDIETGERFTGPTTLEDYPQPFGKIPAFVGGAGVLVHDDGDGLLASVYPVAAPGSSYTFVAPDGRTRSTVATPATSWSPDAVEVVDETGAVVGHGVDATTGAVTFALTPGTDYRLVDRAVEDGASAPPAAGVLSHDNGWDTGLRDGDYTVSMDLWWGENARVVRLYENGDLLATASPAMASPARQHVEFPVTGRPDGTYVYTAELENSRGVTPTAPITVQVTDASPGVPVLSHDNWDGDGDYTVVADLWWGTNATAWRLTEDGVSVAEGTLEPATPRAQHVGVAIAGRAPGEHVYVMTFANPLGETSSAPLAVRVRR